MNPINFCGSVMEITAITCKFWHHEELSFSGCCNYDAYTELTSYAKKFPVDMINLTTTPNGYQFSVKYCGNQVSGPINVGTVRY